MKKIAIITIIVLGISITKVNAQSVKTFLQERLSYGLKLEGNGTNFLLSDMPTVKSEIGFGGTFGGFLKINLSEHFAIQEDILYSYFSSELKQNGVTDTYEYFGMEVPIYFMGQWETASCGHFYVGVGPYFGMGFAAKLKDKDIDLYKKYDGNAPFMKRMTYGGAAQIGYEFKSGLQINTSYKIGTNMLDANKDASSMLPSTVSAGIGYRF